MADLLSGYPRYRRSEEIADQCIHLLGVGLGIGAALALLALAAVTGGSSLLLAIGVYALGLVAMLGCSAAYNLAAPSPRKEWLRRFDHAAIFVMIAGTYTPFLLVRMGGALGLGLLAFVWLIAAIGIGLALVRPRRFERLQLVAYLALGWCVLPAWRQLADAVLAPAVLLLIAGGLLYSIGVAFHLWRRLSYHNAIWHGFVLAAAGCHYAAMLMGVVLV